MSNPVTIDTALGRRCVARIVGGCLQTGYVYTTPTAAAPHGEWWTLNPQHGYVPVPSNSRALMAAVAQVCP